jgi:hypothetical protein
MQNEFPDKPSEADGGHIVEAMLIRERLCACKRATAEGLGHTWQHSTKNSPYLHTRLRLPASAYGI